ncbi:hypothetical protein [Amycolatopsis thermophila]|uniref:Uncharacterized protein n=1 Tax=Amycolatopsis thermophila TaxID=206084 RepID=A0ABU0EWM7_9PSEU|nr:hypothetical protein [Amycolatopsis thermophila]MDQ0379678.1 hypothetical protein [Amycolatopsis thermophila]
MTTVQPPRDTSQERHRIVLDEQFYAALDPAAADPQPARRRGAGRWRFLNRSAESWVRVWHVVLLGMTAVSALAMITFALMKAIPSTALCMLALVAVKIADHWNSRRVSVQSRASARRAR